MEDTAEPGLEGAAVARCPRCLQPVSAKATRCPECFQPIRSHRRLPLVIGVAGLLVMLFAVLVMFRMMRNEDLMRAPVPVDEGAVKESDPFDIPPPASGKPAQPEKRPPLNEK